MVSDGLQDETGQGVHAIEHNICIFIYLFIYIYTQLIGKNQVTYIHTYLHAQLTDRCIREQGWRLDTQRELHTPRN